MPRVTTVYRAAKDQGQCGRCGTPLRAGYPYRHWKFRYGGKHKRCMQPGCTPRGSELTQAKYSGALAAIEDARDSLDGAESTDDLASVLGSAAEGIREVAEEYRDAAEAMGGAGEQMEEWADQLEGAADELDSWVPGVEGSAHELSGDEWEDVEYDAGSALDDAEGECYVG